MVVAAVVVVTGSSGTARVEVVELVVDAGSMGIRSDADSAEVNVAHAAELMAIAMSVARVRLKRQSPPVFAVRVPFREVVVSRTSGATFVRSTKPGRVEQSLRVRRASSDYPLRLRR